jgi:hypothetical protein
MFFDRRASVDIFVLRSPFDERLLFYWPVGFRCHLFWRAMSRHTQFGYAFSDL